MRAVKLAVVLPALFCGIEGILWYWDLHSQPWIPSLFWRVSPAVPISMALDFPATLLNILTVALLETLVGRPLTGTQARLFFLLWVAGSWWFIGNWLDRRVAGENQMNPEALIACPIFPPLALALGVFTLLLSFHLHALYFIETMARALLQTWAVFLIALPAIGIIHRYLDHGRSKYSTEREGQARTPVSNFRLFVIAIGVFATLLIMGVLARPFFTK